MAQLMRTLPGEGPRTAPRWARAGRGRVRTVAMALQRWLVGVGAQAYVDVRGYRTWDGQWHLLLPPLDVLALRGGELSAYRIGLLGPQPVSSIRPGLLPPGAEVEERLPVDPALFPALGEALFALAYAPRVYLVVPQPALTERLHDLVRELPLGLLAFDGDLRFEVLKPAEAVHLEDSEADALLSSARRGELLYYSAG